MAQLPRIMDDGTLVYPKKGDPPTVPLGYFPEPGNPYTLFPELPECSFRGKGINRTACCGESWFYTCLHGWRVSPDECKKCISSGRRPPIVPIILE